jgi:hypothetical protein
MAGKVPEGQALFSRRWQALGRRVRWLRGAVLGLATTIPFTISYRHYQEAIRGHGGAIPQAVETT